MRLHFIMVLEPNLITYLLHSLTIYIARFDHIWAFPFDNVFAWLNTQKKVCPYI